MRRQIVGAFFAAVAAGGAALLTGGLTGPAAADAATAGTHAAAYPVIDTSSQAGYTASGRWIRFVGTTVTVPAAGAYSGYAEVVLSGTHVPPVTLGLKPGGGAGSLGWAVGVAPFGMGGGAFSLAPAVGDSVRIDLYYNRGGGGVAATATDITTNKTQVVNIGEGKNAVFNDAEVASVLRNPASSPTADSRLWQFTVTTVTTYNGVHGTMTGPWTTSEVVDTTNGGASGQTVMSPSFLFANNEDFGVWIRAFLLK
jgi:hypothetical protein